MALQTLKKRRDFLRLASGAKAVTGGLILQGAADIGDSATGEGSSAQTPRFGFTASKKVGNAIARNRVKRRLREAVRLVAPDAARPGHAYVCIGRAQTAQMEFTDLVTCLERGFGEVHRRLDRPRRSERTPPMAD